MHPLRVAIRCCGRLPGRVQHRRFHLVAAFLVAAAALVTAKNIDALVEANRSVQRAHEVTLALQKIEIDLAAAEAHHRELVATDSSYYARQYEDARKRVWSSVARAEQLTRTDPVQHARFTPLRQAMLATFEELDGRSAAARAGQRAQGDDRDAGRNARRAVERQVAVLASAEADLRTAGIGTAQYARIAASASAALTGALGIALMMALASISERERRRMRAAIFRRRRGEETARRRRGSGHGDAAPSEAQRASREDVSGPP